jgi:thioesterase domain-containing protein
MQADDDRTDALLVRLQPRGVGVPLFCIHPTGGQVMCYIPLARELGKERRIFALRSAPLDTVRTPVTLEEMANLYIRTIKNEHKRGPYVLAGWSSGGLIALEMARQLGDGGDNVALVILIDTYPPYHEHRQQNANLPVLAKFALDLCQLLGKNPEPFRERFLTLTADAQKNLIHEELVREQILPQDSSREKVSEMVRIFESNFQATNRYVLRPIRQPIVVISATESGQPERLAQDWQQWTHGKVELVMVPGNHYTMLTGSNATRIAAALEDRLKPLDQQFADS